MMWTAALEQLLRIPEALTFQRGLLPALCVVVFGISLWIFVKTFEQCVKSRDPWEGRPAMFMTISFATMTMSGAALLLLPAPDGAGKAEAEIYGYEGNGAAGDPASNPLPSSKEPKHPTSTLHPPSQRPSDPSEPRRQATGDAAKGSAKPSRPCSGAAMLTLNNVRGAFSVNGGTIRTGEGGEIKQLPGPEDVISLPASLPARQDGADCLLSKGKYLITNVQGHNMAAHQTRAYVLTLSRSGGS